MDRKVVPILTDTRTFFRQYVYLLKPILGIRDKEADVLGELLYYNYRYRDLAEDIRYKIILDYDTRVEIRNNLKISEANFNNSLTALRKAGLLVNNRLPLYITILPKTNKFSLTYTFSIDDTKD